MGHIYSNGMSAAHGLEKGPLEVHLDDEFGVQLREPSFDLGTNGTQTACIRSVLWRGGPPRASSSPRDPPGRSPIPGTASFGSPAACTYMILNPVQRGVVESDVVEFVQFVQSPHDVSSVDVRLGVVNIACAPPCAPSLQSSSPRTFLTSRSLHLVRYISFATSLPHVRYIAS